MKCRIENTRNYYGGLDEEYLEIVKEIFGEIKTRKVYHNINDEKFYVQSFVEVKSLEQLNLLIDKVGSIGGSGIVIYKSSDTYIYIKEVDKFVVYVTKDKYPQDMVIELYDDYRE